MKKFLENRIMILDFLWCYFFKCLFFIREFYVRIILSSSMVMMIILCENWISILNLWITLRILNIFLINFYFSILWFQRFYLHLPFCFQKQWRTILFSLRERSVMYPLSTNTWWLTMRRCLKMSNSPIIFCTYFFVFPWFYNSLLKSMIRWSFILGHSWFWSKYLSFELFKVSNKSFSFIFNTTLFFFIFFVNSFI